MKNNSKIFFIASACLVLLDQATKLAIKGFDFLGFSHEGLHYGEVIPIIGSIIQLTYIENAGMAFGISFGWGKIFLSIFSLIASGLIAYYLYKIGSLANNFVKLALALVLAGAFGNSIDRCFYGIFYGTAPLFYGRVVDFILVDIPDIHIDFLNIHYSYFPVFNVADSCVTCGIILLIFFHNSLPELKNIFPVKIKESKIPDNIRQTNEN